MDEKAVGNGGMGYGAPTEFMILQNLDGCIVIDAAAKLGDVFAVVLALED